MRTLKLSGAALAAAAGLALSAASTLAQPIDWASAVDGNWNDAAKWNPANVPDSAGEQPGLGFNSAYTVTFNQTFSIGALTITNSKVNLDIAPGVFMLPNGDVMNNGAIRVNPGKNAANTHVRFDTSSALAGSGSLILFASPGDLDDAQLITNGSTITQGASHSIRGTGNIHAPLTNNGTIRADSSGEILRVADGTKTNNSLFAASGGGILRVDGTTINQGASGVIKAQNASTVNFSNSGVNGGKVQGEGSGAVNIDGNTTFSSVATTGTVNVLPGTYLLVGGTGLLNDGIVTINPAKSPSNAHVRFDSSSTLGGSGALLLQANPGDLDDAQLITNGSTITQDVNHLIHGTGTVHAPIINNGTVRADVSGEILRVADGSKTNNSLFVASGGGILRVDGQTLTQGQNGVIKAQDASAVNMSGATVIGGKVQTEGSGTVNIDGVSTFSSVASTAALNVRPGTFLLVTGTGLQNDGVITINPDKNVNNAHLRFDATATLGGTGALLLQANPQDLDDAQLITNGSTITHGPDHLVHGTGAVHAPLVNEGTILADVPGEVLQIDSGTKTNNALFAATGGGILRLSGTTINQGAGGVVLAEDASAISFVSMTLSGGTLQTEGSGVAYVDAATGFTAVTNEGEVRVNPGAILLINGGLTNNSVIIVNPDKNPNNASIRVDSSGDIAGDGVIILRSGNDDIGDAQFNSNGTAVVLGPDLAVRGTGQLNAPFTNKGTLAPGESIGRFQFNGTLALSESSVYEVEVAGVNAGQFDSISVSSTATVGGALSIALTDGFVPEGCTKIPVLTAGSVVGEFDSVNGDAGNGRIWRAIYSSNKVEAVVTCYPDMLVDCKLDLFDFLEFVNLFNEADPITDCTHDGKLDLFDFLCFVNLFNKGC